MPPDPGLADDLTRRLAALPVKRPDCPGCEQIHAARDEVLQALQWDEYGHAAALLAVAERVEHSHPAAPSPVVPRNHGQVPGFTGTGRPLVAATDGSWRPKERRGGFSFVTSEGRWALSAWYHTGRLDPSGPSIVAEIELRAVALLLESVTDPIIVDVDSELALHYLRAWQDGRTGVLPDGYSLRPRISGKPPTLTHLAETVAARIGLTFRHVPSHTGQPLNEAADALARLASRGSVPDQPGRAAGLVEAFVRDWHNTQP